MEDWAREDFVPHIWVLTENTVPSQVNICALTGGADKYKRIPLSSSIGTMSRIRQTERIGQIIRNHYERTQGGVQFFGKITGYVYCVEYEKRVEFSVEGKPLRVVKGVFREGRAVVRIGNKELDSGLPK